MDSGRYQFHTLVCIAVAFPLAGGRYFTPSGRCIQALTYGGGRIVAESADRVYSCESVQAQQLLQSGCTSLAVKFWLHRCEYA